MLPIKLTASTPPAQAAAATHAARQERASAPWPVVAACAALVTKTHTLQRAIARANAAAALVPQGAGTDWLAAFAARLGRTQTEAATKAAAWATLYVQELSALQPKVEVPAEVPSVPTPQPTPAPVENTGRYRYQQPLLFQPVPATEIASRLPGGAPLKHDIYGPTAEYVDCATGWRWDRKGSDWIDADGVRHGTKPWFVIHTDPQGAEPRTRTYMADATPMVKHCQANGRWLAMLLVSNAGRTLAGRETFVMTFNYEDGSSETVRPWCVAAVGNSDMPATAAAGYAPPCFVEFERPSRKVGTAKLGLTVLHHWSGSDTSIRAYLLDPPINAEPVQYGNGAGLIGRHDYLDGKTLADFVHNEPINHSDERYFDPALWDGERDTTLLPHRGAGKWILSSEDRANWSLVSSTYRGEGFLPLAPSVGAIRLQMNAVPGVTDGTVVGSNGTLGSNGMLYLPEPLFGRLNRIFVRYYFRMGGPYNPQPGMRKNVRHDAGGQPDWTTMGGKWAIAPDHSTSWGGFSGSSGGRGGWQMRGAWYDCDAGLGGPDEGGIHVGYHFYDFYRANPSGHNYGSEQQAMLERWGQRGGLGGMLYPGHWYCIETEMKLNGILEPGFVPDGELRTWIDGRLAYERTGMVFRTGPVLQVARVDGRIRPCRTLGVRGLLLNWFHGGKTWNTYDRTVFYTALAYGNQYIGPMPNVITQPA